MPEFVVRTTGMEYELMERFSFDKTYRAWEGIRGAASCVDEEKIARIFRDELSDKQKALHGIFLRADLGEAVYLQNSGVYRRMMKDFENDGKRTRNKHDRVTDNKLILYLQRFCGKNETHAYFGPIFWGKRSGKATASLRLTRGVGGWLKKRRAFMETWAVEALARAIGSDEALREFLPIRLAHDLRISRGHVYRAEEDLTGRLSRIECACLSLAAGGGTVGGVQRALAPSSGEEGVRAALAGVIAKGLLTQGLYVCRGRADSLGELIQWVKDLPRIHPRRRHWLGVLGRFRKAEKEIAARSLEDKIALEQKMMDDFAQLTGERAVRETSGKIYVGRRLYFEEAHRNAALTLGGELGRDVEKWLSVHWKLCLLQTMARVRDARGYLKDYIDGRRGNVWWGELIGKWEEYQRSHPAHTPSGQRIHLEITKRMERLFGTRMDGHVISCRLADFDFLDDMIASEGVLSERFAVSWDILLSAENRREIERGNYQWVLGEHHYKTDVLFSNHYIAFAWMRGSPRDLTRYLRRYTGGGERYAFRCYYDGKQPFRYVAIEGADIVDETTRCSLPVRCANRTPAGELQAVVRGGRILIRNATDGSLCESVDLKWDSMGQGALGDLVYPHAYLAGVSPKHCPRIEIEKAVLQREQWLLNRDDLGAYDFGRRGLDLLREFSRFRRDHGFPRHVFVRVHGERKPVLLDFQNYFLIEVLAKMIKKCERVRIVEMFPDPEHLWFQDERGRYTAEFRWMGGLER